jgi:hypothetical protein
MTEFEKVLQECLHDLERGVSNVDDCLDRYPGHARQLEPILLTSTHLARAGTARPSNAFKARVRTKLIQQMRAHPRQRKAAGSGFMFARWAMGLAVVLLALLTAGTVYAQGALPGEAFYAWKLASENVWRAISPDPVKTDLAIAEHRVDELIAVSDDPVLYSQALEAYLEVAARLKSQVNAENETHILAVLDTQVEELNQSGILLPQPDQEVLPSSDEPTLVPATPIPVLTTPQVDSTDLPQIIPTRQAPPEIVPTVEVPEEIIPTIQDPPNLIPTVEITLPIP